MLQWNNLACGYDSQSIVHSAEGILRQGELKFLFGRNGSGKSTLIKTLAGVLPEQDGQVLFMKKPPHISRDLKLRPAYMPAQADISPHILGLDLIDLYQLESSKWFSKENLDLLRVQDLLNRPLSKLSSGERQRMLLAVTLGHPSNCVLLDEPLSYLDWNHCLRAERIILSQRQQGRTFLIAIHDFSWSLRIPDSKSYLIDQGRLQADMNTAELLVSKLAKRVFEIRTQVIKNPLDQTHLLALASINADSDSSN